MSRQTWADAMTWAEPARGESDGAANSHMPTHLPNTGPSRLAHFNARVLADALAEATSAFWERRAAAFMEAAPRPGDYPGRATPAALAAASQRCLETAQACRGRASLEGPGLPVPPIVVAALSGVIHGE